jgi:hypothetical protein
MCRHEGPIESLQGPVSSKASAVQLRTHLEALHEERLDLRANERGCGQLVGHVERHGSLQGLVIQDGRAHETR